MTSSFTWPVSVPRSSHRKRVRKTGAKWPKARPNQELQQTAAAILVPHDIKALSAAAAAELGRSADFRDCCWEPVTFRLPVCLSDTSSRVSAGIWRQHGDNLMTGQTNQNQKRMFAVAVRDGADLFLVLSICRGPQGDVYVNFPRDHEPDWKPHSSYHASGQHHQKSFGHKALVHHRQKPNANFSGTENVVTTGIALDEPRAINKPCDVADFQEVFEIPLSELRPEQYRTLVSVDMTEPSGQPIITPGATVIRQAVFKDAVPWILVTLFDTGSDKA
jgi:hypothetical protein